MRSYVLTFYRSGKKFTVTKNSLYEILLYNRTLKKNRLATFTEMKTYSEKYKTYIKITESKGLVNFSFQLNQKLP